MPLPGFSVGGREGASATVLCESTSRFRNIIDKFPGDYEQERLGFQAFGPQYHLGVSFPVCLGRGSILESVQFTPHQTLSWAMQNGGSLLSRVENFIPL